MTNLVQRRKMRRVVLESPWAGEGGPLEHLTLAQRIEIHRHYAHAALRDCVERGEAPFASHVLYTGAYPVEGGEQRVLCMAAGFEWGRVAEACVVYDDLGVTVGMVHGIANARAAGAAVEHRQLGGEWSADVVLMPLYPLRPCDRCEGEWDSGTLIGGFGIKIEALCNACLKTARDNGEVVQEAAKFIEDPDPYADLMELEVMEAAGASHEEIADKSAELRHARLGTRPHEFMDHTNCSDAKRLGQKTCDSASCWICEGTLKMCRVCRQAEAELELTCPGPPPPKPKPAEPYRHLSTAEFDQLLVNLKTEKERRKLEAYQHAADQLDAQTPERFERLGARVAAMPTDKLTGLLPDAPDIAREAIYAELDKREDATIKRAAAEGVTICPDCGLTPDSGHTGNCPRRKK